MRQLRPAVCGKALSRCCHLISKISSVYSVILPHQATNAMLTNDLYADFTKQINQMMGKLHQYALRLTKDAEDANDLVQDTLLKAFRYWHTFKPGTNLIGWLFTIMSNTFITQCNRAKRERQVVVQTSFQLLGNLTGGALPNEAVGQAVLDDIRAATAQLTDVYREPLQLHLDGFKYHEIARQLSIPLGTVKNRIFIARKELKRRLLR